MYTSHAPKGNRSAGRCIRIGQGSRRVARAFALSGFARLL